MEVSIIYAYPNNNSYNLSILETEKKNLSPATRQVTYALLTRSQLIQEEQAPLFSVLLACIRHAASVRPEPGSNSH